MRQVSRQAGGTSVRAVCQRTVTAADSKPRPGSGQLEQLRQAGGDELGAGDVLAVGGPLAQLFLGRAEEAHLQVVDVALHLLEVLGPVERLAGADALLALPAHAVE